MGKRTKQKGKRPSSRNNTMCPKGDIPKKTYGPDAKEGRFSVSVTARDSALKSEAQPNRKSAVTIGCSIGVAFVIICYGIPCIVKAFFAIIGYIQPTLNIYISSIDRPLAWTSILLAIVSLYKGSKSDIAAQETAQLIRDMQGTINGLNWQMDTANTMLRGMYTVKSGAREGVSPMEADRGSGWSQDHVRET